MAITIPTLGKVSYEPIKPWRNISGGSSLPQMMRVPESATQTFKIGTPLMMSSGYAVAYDGGTSPLIGFAAEPGHNLASSGVAEAGYSEGTAQNQASSKIIPVGAHFKDGKVGVYVVNGITTFAGAVNIGTDVFAQTLVVPGTYYGITKDTSSGFWYIDLADTSGNNAIIDLLGLDSSSPNTTADGARVFFQIKAAARAFTL